MTFETQVLPIQAKFLEVRIIFQKILGVGLELLEKDRSVSLTTSEDGLTITSIKDSVITYTDGPVVEFDEYLTFYSPDIIYPYPYGETHIKGYKYNPLVFNINCCGLLGEAVDATGNVYDISGVERIMQGRVLKKVHDVLIPITKDVADALKEALEVIGVDNNDLWVEDFDTRLYVMDYKYRREHNMPLI